MNTIDVPVMCAWCWRPYWLTEATVEGELTWELSDEDGEIVEVGYGEPKCPLCGGPLVEDPLEEPDPPTC